MATKYLKEKLGYRVDKVERYLPYHGNEQDKRGGFRRDMFMFADLIAMRKGVGIVAVQVTGQTGHSAHKRKILNTEDARYWLECGGRIALWSWKKVAKRKKDGSPGKQMVWKPRQEEIKLSMFEGEE
jgi:hypothetical protein